MSEQIPVDRAAVTGDEQDDGTIEVAPDLAYKRLAIVNVAFFGAPGLGRWVLIDGGTAGTANHIADAAADRFGDNSRPAAIILTHGHFDHVGAVEELAERWDVPVYAHELELPYLDGRRAYPPPDPKVGGGLVAVSSRLFPRGPVNVSRWLRTLPADGSVPGMPGWRWVHTPGHTDGHVALWCEEDEALISGDAFITTNQESAYAVAVQKPEIHGPPAYFTPDWDAARESVRRLAALDPELVVSMHGRAMRGTAMRSALHALARDFDTVARPRKGRYADAAHDQTSGPELR